jgi:hypothetical protein
MPPAYTPFIDPLPIWNYWMWLLIPLTIGVSVVYKAVKCRHVEEIPRQAAGISFWILFGMSAAAAGLWLLVALLER